jgi:sigma-B regulation protein RsbU (phosphoserine phosphatase)
MTNAHPVDANPVAVRSVLDALVRGELSVEAAEAALVRSVPTDAALRDIAETVQGLIAGIEEFKDVMGSSAAETDKLLKLARRRFAIQVSATMLDEPIPMDTQATASTSMRKLREELVSLADRVAELVQNTIRDSQLRKELEIAGTVQKMLVPSDTVSAAGLKAHAWYRGADQCSGDWWSLAKLGQQDAMMVIGDVTGHGAPAAIIAGTAKGALDLARIGMRDALKPFMAMNMVNHILLDSMKGEYFMTCVIARYELEKRQLRVSNAGHRPPWILREGGTQTVSGDRAPPLGSSRSTKYGEEVVQLAVGDIIVLYTDGLPEAESTSGQQFGERALRDICERARAKGPAAICDAVRNAIQAHVGDINRLADDVTLLVVQVET